MVLRAMRWGIAVAGGLLVILALIAGAGSRTDKLKQLVIDTLAIRLDSQVELGSFSVDTFPTVHVTGSGLTIRHKGRRDLPPLIKIHGTRNDPKIGLDFGRTLKRQ